MFTKIKTISNIRFFYPAPTNVTLFSICTNMRFGGSIAERCENKFFIVFILDFMYIWSLKLLTFVIYDTIYRLTYF